MHRGSAVLGRPMRVTNEENSGKTKISGSGIQYNRLPSPLCLVIFGLETFEL